MKIPQRRSWLGNPPYSEYDIQRDKALSDKMLFRERAHTFVENMPDYASFNPSPARGHFPEENGNYVAELGEIGEKLGLWKVLK